MRNRFISINGTFSKWFIEDKGRNKTPISFAWYTKNVRIQNWCTTIRKWISESLTLPGQIRGMHVTNTTTWSSASYKLLTVAGTILYDQLWTNLWTITWTWKVNFISYGRYTVILTWWTTYVYSQSWWLVTVPAQNFESSNIVWSIPQANPLIGASLTWFTFIANNVPWYRNILHISKPITPDTPENCYDRSTTTWGNNQYNDVWENRAMPSNIVWMIWNLNYLYIFCERTIEVLERNSVQQFNSKWYLVTTPIGDWDQLANPRSTICAGQNVFYFTRNLEIKTLNLEPGLAYPQIGTLSDSNRHSIKWRIDRNLSRDQRDAFMIYDKKENTIELYCKSKNSSYNDKVIVYSLYDDSFTIDEWKIITHWTNDYFSWLDTVFLGGASWQVYIDDDLYHDEPNSWQIVPISFEYDTINIAPWWDPTRESMFRWYGVAWAMNTLSQIRFTSYIDWKQEHDKTIRRSDIKPSELQAINIWWPDRTPDSFEELSPFEYVADHWVIRKKWKRFRLKVRGDTVWQNFYLDTLSIHALSTWNAELSDKY